METPQDNLQSIQKPPSLGAEEDQEPQPGGKAVVSEAGEEGIDKKERVMSGLAQGGLDQGDGAQGEVAGGEQAQEEPAPLSPAQEATGGGEEGENKEGEMEGRHAGDGASGPEDDNIQEEGGENRDQQPPQQEAASPEGMRNPQAGNSLAHQRTRRIRFTHSQLRDLERLFQENRFPSLRVRRDLARWMGVDESDVQEWFKMRRALFRRHSRLMMFCELPPITENNSP
ncbi:rhox homeobox family member 2-like [Mus caroli]|uniref:Rhox homeobox family member 2-like n=1 Tax=Mus caroli TaxID=10089 RepID=A0A6P5P394_MUSCR|nr:rhox homeobox family member 2-like [Mus caroli]